MNSRQLRSIAAASIVVLSSLALALPAGAAILIDDYSIPLVPDALVGAFGGVDSRVDVLPSPIPYPYGGRTTTVTAAPAGVISATVGGGQLIDVAALGAGGTVQLAYVAPGAGPVNFLAGGATHFAFDLLSSDDNGLLTVTIVANGISSTGPVAIPSNPNPSTFLVPIPVNPNFAAAGFFDVFFDLSGGATSVSIDRFYTAAIPEPSMALIWGLVSVSLGLIRAGRGWAL
jgi:hypothetical protein